MALSGTSTFNLTRDDIVSAAGRKLGVIGQGVTMSADMQTNFIQGLNALVKRWQAMGLHVWKVSEATLIPQVSQVSYNLGTGTDNVTSAYYQTTTSAAAALHATTISLTSTANITVNDQIGFVLNGGTLFWTTVSSKTSTTVTIPATGVTDTVLSGAYVFNYTTRIVRPLKIVSARRHVISSGLDTPIKVIARLDYRDLPNKTQTGTINQVFYDPQLTTGILSLWSPPSVIDTVVNFTWHQPIQDFNSSGDNADLPQEWIDCLIFNLALVMAPEYSVPTERYTQIKELAVSFLDDMQGFDRENESIYFGVDTNP